MDSLTAAADVYQSRIQFLAAALNNLVDERGFIVLKAADIFGQDVDQVALVLDGLAAGVGANLVKSERLFEVKKRCKKFWCQSIHHKMNALAPKGEKKEKEATRDEMDV